MDRLIGSSRVVNFGDNTDQQIDDTTEEVATFCRIAISMGPGCEPDRVVMGKARLQTRTEVVDRSNNIDC
jgi:hypothetical protein